MASLANTTSVTLNLVLRMAIERVLANLDRLLQLGADAEKERVKTHTFFTEGTFTSSPAKALPYRFFDCSQKFLVDLV